MSGWHVSRAFCPGKTGVRVHMCPGEICPGKKIQLLLTVGLGASDADHPYHSWVMVRMVTIIHLSQGSIQPSVEFPLGVFPLSLPWGDHLYVGLG